MKSATQKSETESNTKIPSTRGSTNKSQASTRETGSQKASSSRSAKQGEKKTTPG